MTVNVTDETRAYMCLSFLLRSQDEDYARHMETEARRWGATDAQIADAWKTRARLNAPQVIEGAA